MDIGQLITQYGLPAGALVIVSVFFYRELKERANKSEAREEKLIGSFDKLAEAVEAQNDITKALLAEREGRRTK